MKPFRIISALIILFLLHNCVPSDRMNPEPHYPDGRDLPCCTGGRVSRATCDQHKNPRFDRYSI